MQRCFYNYPYLRSSQTDTNSNDMTIYGNGSVKVRPDIATASLGVITENKNLKNAQEENAIIANKVLNTLKHMGIKDRDIKTENYSISPEYDYVEGKQVFRAYRVVNSFMVIFRDINMIGKTIDAVVASGANTVNNITFTVEDTERLYNQALKIAVKNAQEKANALEESLNIIVNKIPVRITEERQEIKPIGKQAFYAAPIDSTPIKEGEIEISASVKVVFNYFSRKF